LQPLLQKSAVSRHERTYDEIAEMPGSSSDGDSAKKEIEIEHWSETPCILHRLATEDDAQTGRAVFCVPNPSESESKPVDLSLPHCALLAGDDGQVSPVIVVQAETHRAAAELFVLIEYATLAGELSCRSKWTKLGPPPLVRRCCKAGWGGSRERPARQLLSVGL
jgi:hypothetical protein